MEIGRRRRPESESGWASERRAGERWARKRMQAPRASRRDRVCSPRGPRSMRLHAHRCGSAGCSLEAVDPPTTVHQTASQVADPLVGYDGAVGPLEGHSARHRTGRRALARSDHSLERGPRAQTSRHAENRGCEATSKRSPPGHRTRGARVVEMGFPAGSQLALVPSEMSPPVEMGGGSWASTNVPHARSVGCHWLRMWAGPQRPCARPEGCHLPNAALEGLLEALYSSGVCWRIVAALEGCSPPSDS